MKKFLVVLLAVLAVAAAYMLLTRDREIPVTIIEDRMRIGDQESTGKRWYAKDRARIEVVMGKHSVTSVARLDKGEVWVCDPKKRTCTVHDINELKTEMRKMNEQLLEQARRDPGWRQDLNDLTRVLSGDYEIRVGKVYTDDSGRKVRKVGARVGNVFRYEAVVTWDERMLDGIDDVGEAFTILGGAEGAGYSSYQWQKKAREYESWNLTLQKRVWLRLPGAGNRSDVVSITVVKVASGKAKRSLFEMPSGYRVVR